MPKVKQPKFPSMLLPLLKKEKIKLKTFKSAKAFEKVLLKFLKEQNVLHLCTCKNNLPRATPIEYRLHGLTFYILSEGGGKFNNLKVNNNVSFSIAAPYDSNKDYWGAKGVQVWGKAKVYSMKTNPRRFKDALKKMKVYETMKKMGMKDLPPQINYRIIEITPDRINYGNLREGIYHVTWMKK
jgi:uncharacterized protein YhbP (UPF0306 family)